LNNLIEIKNASFYYDDVLALNELNFSVGNEKIVLLGNNGSGKSTLLRILAGLYPLKRGEYLFEGKRVKPNKEFRKKIGILFQNPDSMIFNPTVFDEIAFSLREFGMSDIESRVIDIAKMFEITNLLDKNPLNLSGGEKQKVILASIIVYNPKILLLDEPTSAMDPRTTGWFVDFMYENKTPFIIATHDIKLAYELGDRAIVMSEEHKIIYDGDVEELMGNLDILLKANLIYKPRVNKRDFYKSIYHKHF
jgi:cobalt/nickel transport system ATP-binding protein